MKTQDDIDAFNKRNSVGNSVADRRIRDKRINRFELIDASGRVVVEYGVSVELLYQDDGRTLKVVLRDTNNES
tara:strand:+ start:322 stop:540 length:219 start_codon:yes stop_codon:yes gene_type:complete